MDLTGIEPPKRPDLYVVARFLDRLAHAPEGVTHARLQLAVRLNYDLYRSYLALLVDRGFAKVDRDEKGERVVPTDAGISAQAKLLAWIRDAFGDVRL